MKKSILFFGLLIMSVVIISFSPKEKKDIKTDSLIKVECAKETLLAYESLISKYYAENVIKTEPFKSQGLLKTNYTILTPELSGLYKERNNAYTDYVLACKESGTAEMLAPQLSCSECICNEKGCGNTWQWDGCKVNPSKCNQSCPQCGSWDNHTRTVQCPSTRCDWQ